MPGYTIHGSRDGVLKNKLGASSDDRLERLEADHVHRRLVELRLTGAPAGQFDAEHLKAIHRHLFQDVYEWAGRTRNEEVKLTDGTVATEPLMRKPGGNHFLAGPIIPSALDKVAKDLREADYLRHLPREEFTSRAADVMTEINAIHPFREGNGRSQRVFIELLAAQAGHRLDFSVVSKERMIQASVAAHEHDDPSMMRRLFDEISNPKRVAALRQAIDALEEHDAKAREVDKIRWNERYIATMQPAQRVNVFMVGFAGDNFMARTESEILIGRSSDLPKPTPHRGDRFTMAASENAWSDSRDDLRRRQQEESDRHQAPAVESAAREERARDVGRRPAAAGETKTSKQRESFTPPGQDRPPDRHGHTHDRGRGGRGGRSR